MPSFFISHKAPALFIKLKCPKQIDITAICIGTIIPDLNLIFNFISRNFSHSLVGIVILTVPVKLILTMAFNRYLAPLTSWISKKNWFLLKPLRYFGLDDIQYLSMRKYNKKFILIASYSAFIGGLTYILLDLPSHPFIEIFYLFIVFNNPLIPNNVYLNFGTISIFSFQIQLIIKVNSLIRRLWDCTLIPITLFLLRYIKKNELVQEWSKNK